MPWSLAMISTRSFCQMPTHEYVVPRSMPTAGPEGASLPMFLRVCGLRAARGRMPVSEAGVSEDGTRARGYAGVQL